MKLKRIIQMLSEGKSLNEICRQTSSSKKTVSRYKKLAEDTKFSYVELLQMEYSELEELLQPPMPPSNADPRKEALDAMMPEIIQCLSKRYSNKLLVYNEFYLKKTPRRLWLHTVQEVRQRLHQGALVLLP